MGEVSLLINGLYVKVPVGQTLLQAARQLDIDIPTLCYHPDLKPEGQCRLCLVEIGEWPHTRLVNSCTYPAEKGSECPDPFRQSPGGPPDGPGTVAGPHSQG